MGVIGREGRDWGWGSRRDEDGKGEKIRGDSLEPPVPPSRPFTATLSLGRARLTGGPRAACLQAR